MIGKPFGSKIYSKSSHGWIHVLEPTPELWSGAVYVICYYYYLSNNITKIINYQNYNSNIISIDKNSDSQ